jgi:hypothetical protein
LIPFPFYPYPTQYLQAISELKGAKARADCRALVMARGKLALALALAHMGLIINH